MTDHKGHEHPREVWVVYSLPEPPASPIPCVLWTLAVPVDATAPCNYCRRIGITGPCPGDKAHAYAQYARLSIRRSLTPLGLDRFALPPHVSVEMCATHLYALIVKRVNENRPPATGKPDGPQ